MFTGNTNLLVSAAVLQDYLVDKSSGLPLAAGVVTCYQDNNRSVLKNWYYQTGVPGNYTYYELPNPMTLTAVGTIADPNGNDTIPFFYPYNSDGSELETYYITVYNSDGQVQFTRQNFPFVQQGSSAGSSSLKNYLTNGVYWRNCGTAGSSSTYTQLPLTIDNQSVTYYYQTLAPSNHDGFNMPDLIYINNATGSTETLTFNTFPGGQTITANITPEYYLNFNCTAVGSETLKCIQFPLSLHLKSVQGVQGTILFEAQNVSGANTIIPAVWSFNGTGVNQTTAAQIETVTLQAAGGWASYAIPFTFPTPSGSASTTGDDAYYLQLQLPTSGAFSINIGKVSVYFGDSYPTADTETYDQVDAIISSPRTGDIRTSLNSFYPFGWVPMSDGTIGNASSNATARKNTDTWPLFSLIWNLFSIYTSGSTNFVSQMYTSAGAPVAYGSSAYDDFIANHALSLTATLGRVLMGTVPVSALLTNSFSQTFTASNSAGNLLLTCNSTNSPDMFQGMPITFSNSGGSLPGNLNAHQVFYVASILSTTTFYVATTYDNALAGTYISYSSAGSGTNTFFTGMQGTYTGQYAHTQLISELAAHTHTFQTSGAAGTTPSIIKLGVAPSGAFNTDSTGSSAPFNVTQPGTFYNMYIKL